MLPYGLVIALIKYHMCLWVHLDSQDNEVTLSHSKKELEGLTILIIVVDEVSV